MPHGNNHGHISTSDALEMKRASEAALRKRGFSSAHYVRKKKRTTRCALIVVLPTELAGVLEILPAAKFLNERGYRVFIKCRSEWHDIFECVNYCEPDDGFRKYDLILDPSRAWKTATTTVREQWQKHFFRTFAKYVGEVKAITFSRTPKPSQVVARFCFAWNGNITTSYPLRYLPWIIAHADDLRIQPQSARETLLILDGLNKPNVKLFTYVNSQRE
jgi:hypothetical protein